MACYKLEEYESALQAFEQGQEVAEDKNPQYGIWAQKCRIALAGMSPSIPHTLVKSMTHNEC